MIHNTTRRPPKKKAHGFSWGRFPIVSTDGVTAVEWRMFRRDHRGAVHFECRLYPVGVAPAEVAQFLRRAKRVLRDRVDEIDLVAMDEAA